jgi:hypothetical protein
MNERDIYIYNLSVVNGLLKIASDLCGTNSTT